MKISIQNLKHGLSKYAELVKPDFVSSDLEHYYPGSFQVDVLIDKFDHDYMVKLKLRTKAVFTCDRCLTEFDEDIELQQEQIYKSGAVELDMQEDIIPLSLDATEIDLTDLLNEAVIINHPIKMLCKENCKGICPGCGVNLNEDACACDKAGSDPRWDELRKLIK